MEEIGLGLPDLGNLQTKKVNFNKALDPLKSWDWGEAPDTEFEIINNFIEDGWVGDFHLDMILTHAILVKASDVHIVADQEVAFSIIGDIVKVPEYPIPDEEIMQAVTEGVLSHVAQGQFSKDLDIDSSYEIKHGPLVGRRFRASLGYSFGNNFIVFRIINDKIPSTKELEIEEEIIKWSKLPNGLFLICGATGTGKSTTLASIVRETQLTTKKKIITIENPIEYIYPTEGSALVVQRAVGQDVVSFYSGLTAAMRQAPDIIMLGEVRDTKEVTEVIRAAETGHLAISTMHTNSVATTINRILNLFEGPEKQRIMSTLSDTLRGIANQVLVRDGNGGRFALREVLTITPEIREMIVAGDVHAIRKHMRDNHMTLEYQLALAVRDNRCTYEEALEHTAFPDEFEAELNRL